MAKFIEVSEIDWEDLELNRHLRKALINTDNIIAVKEPYCSPSQSWCWVYLNSFNEAMKVNKSYEEMAALIDDDKE